MDARDELAWLRERAAAVINIELERAGMVERVDHRSHAARGLDIEPGEHLGPAAMAVERKGGSTDVGERNRRRRRRRRPEAQMNNESPMGLSFFPDGPDPKGGLAKAPLDSPQNRATGNRLRSLARARSTLAAPSLAQAVKRGARQAERVTQTLLED